MLRPNIGYSYKDIESTAELFEQLSISLDNSTYNKFLKHKHISSKPKLKRLLKAKPSTYITYCSRCKKEAGVDEDECEAEKEVEFKKDLLQKRVQIDTLDTEEISKNDDKTEEYVEYQEGKSQYCQPNDKVSVSQSVFFGEKPSIVGDNEFWLPQCSLNEAKLETIQPFTSLQPNEAEQTIETETECGHKWSLHEELTEFFHTIFKNTVKHAAKIHQTVTLLDETQLTLTDDYLFKTQRESASFAVIQAILLRDVLKILVNEDSTMFVLGVSDAVTQTEFKEFVPGNSEKTESFISLMVFSLSRIHHFLPHVSRLPLLSLPTCKRMQSWFLQHDEEILYTGLALAETVFNPVEIFEENVMMKLSDMHQFHPVNIMLNTSCITTKCSGGCNTGECKYSLTIMNSDITFVTREDNPWPNCVNLATDTLNISFASSNNVAADTLTEKLYHCSQTLNQASSEYHVFVFVTEYSLQLFNVTPEKNLVFGSPLLNLDITCDDVDEATCIIDFQGLEVDDTDSIHADNHWHIKFRDVEEKMRFVNVAVVE